MINKAYRDELLAKARVVHKELNELCDAIDDHSIASKTRSYEDVRFGIGEACDRVSDLIWDLTSTEIVEGSV